MTGLAPYFPPVENPTAEFLRGARWAATCARATADRCPDDWQGVERARALKTFAETVSVTLDAVPPTTGGPHDADDDEEEADRGGVR